jgi:hypothetical protein
MNSLHHGGSIISTSSSGATGHNSVFVHVIPNRHNMPGPHNMARTVNMPGAHYIPDMDIIPDMSNIPNMSVRHPPGMSHDPRVLNKRPQIMTHPVERFQSCNCVEGYENARDALNYNTISNTWKKQSKYTL